jgi:hypothetical protein
VHRHQRASSGALKRRGGPRVVLRRRQRDDVQVGGVHALMGLELGHRAIWKRAQVNLEAPQVEGRLRAAALAERHIEARRKRNRRTIIHRSGHAHHAIHGVDKRGGERRRVAGVEHHELDPVGQSPEEPHQRLPPQQLSQSRLAVHQQRGLGLGLFALFRQIAPHRSPAVGVGPFAVAAEVHDVRSVTQEMAVEVLDPQRLFLNQFEVISEPRPRELILDGSKLLIEPQKCARPGVRSQKQDPDPCGGERHVDGVPWHRIGEDLPQHTISHALQ